MVLVFVYLNCNRQLPGHLQIEDKQVNCAVGLVVKSGRNPFTDGLENWSVMGEIVEN